MATTVAGIVLDADWSAPLSGVTVYAFSTNGYTEGSDTTDSNGYFIIAQLTDRDWMAKLAPSTEGNILLVPLDPTPPEHRNIRGVDEDQHHDEVHYSEHHTGGEQALSLGLIAGTLEPSGHGDQGTEALAVHSLMSDADADTLIQLEEAADEDKVRIDTGGTERVVIDSTGVVVGILVRSDADNTDDLGAMGKRWKNLYLSGDLKDDTYSLSVDDLMKPTRTVVLTAAGGAPTTTSGCSAPTKNEAGTNDVDYWSLDFATGSSEYAFWNIIMPENWDGGTITFIPHWTAASGSGGVVWQLAGRSYANSDAIDQAYTDAGETSIDTLITAEDVHIGPASSAVTINGGGAGGEYVQLRLMRDHDHASDTLAVDAKLLGIKIKYTTNAYEDVT